MYNLAIAALLCTIHFPETLSFQVNMTEHLLLIIQNHGLFQEALVAYVQGK